MKIELKKIKHSPSLSEETNAFTADLYINGILAGYCRNSGQGGNTNISANDKKGNDLIQQAELSFKGKKVVCNDFGKPFEFDHNLEYEVDTQLENYIADTTFNKKQNKGICIGDNKNDFSIITWKGHTIDSLLKLPQGKIVLQNKIMELKKKGENILNTNLEGLI